METTNENRSVEELCREHEEEQLERAGLDSRRGLKIFDYCTQTYNYYCGECMGRVNKGDVCECGWRTVEFREAGL